MVSKLLLWCAVLNTFCNADKIFVTYPVTGGTPAVAGKPLEIQWEPVTDSSGPPFPSKIGIDLMMGDDNAASKAMTIVGKEVDPRAGSYKWERVPKDLDPHPAGGGYFLRLGSVQDGYFYGSRFQIKGATGESDPDKKPSGSDKNDKPKEDKDKDSKPTPSSSSSRRPFGNKPKEQAGSEVRTASATRTPKTSSGESFKRVGGLASAVLVVSSSVVFAYMLV